MIVCLVKLGGKHEHIEFVSIVMEIDNENMHICVKQITTKGDMRPSCKFGIKNNVNISRNGLFLPKTCQNSCFMRNLHTKKPM